MPEDELDDDRRDALDAIALHARAGFEPAERIAEIVLERAADPDALDDAWLRAAVDAAMVAKRRDEAAWPAATDCDRLDALFAALNAAGVVALQNAGYTQSEGFSDAVEARGDAPDADGYCFYHGQDVERAVGGGDLWLAFGSFDADDAVRVGARVRDAARAHGFDVEWDGTAGTRLRVRGIDWKRRSPRDA